VQLIGRSNQFNLTTRRYCAADMQRMRSSSRWVTCVVRLADRFGDNGLISVVLAEQQRDRLHVDTWLMSCRVLKRGVESLVLNHVVAIARQRGLTRVTGEYLPTSKNGLVRDHYPNLGFVLQQTDADGRTTWELDLREARTPLTHFISVEAP
jgi:FkbH-like protein